MQKKNGKVVIKGKKKQTEPAQCEKFMGPAY